MLKTFENCVTPDELRNLQFPLVVVPFNGIDVPVVLRELNQVQIRSCGNFSLIETFEDKIRIKESSKISDIVKYTRTMSNIVEAALVKPTYAEIMAIFDADGTLKGFKEKLQVLRKKLHSTPGGAERTALEDEIAMAEALVNSVLPTDFLSTITAYALGIEKSDIKEITNEVLLDCAILAHSGHDNPADHLEGNFTAFMRDDINRRAWETFHNWREKESKKNQRGRTRNLTGR